MASSAIKTPAFLAKAGNIQNEDGSSIYSNGDWSLKNSSAVARVTIKDDGKVGVGTASPSAALDVTSSDTLVSEFNGTNASNTAEIIVRSNGGVGNNTRARIIAGYEAGGPNYGGFLAFSTTSTSNVNTERMRIAASGDVLVGTTSAIAGGQAPGLDILNASTTSTQIRFRNSGAAAGRYWRIGSDSGGTAYFINGLSAGVYMSYGNTGWTGLSDERHKTDLKAIENAAVKVASLRAVTGRYKTDEEGKSRAFLIAQDVEKVLPEAVDTSNEERWGITYTDTIPLLVAAIQELSAKNEALEARLAALEAK